MKMAQSTPAAEVQEMTQPAGVGCASTRVSSVMCMSSPVRAMRRDETHWFANFLERDLGVRVEKQHRSITTPARAAHDQKPPRAVENDREERHEAPLNENPAQRGDIDGGRQDEGRKQPSQHETGGEPALVLVGNPLGFVRDFDRFERVTGRNPPVQRVEQLRGLFRERISPKPTPRPAMATTRNTTIST